MKNITTLFLGYLSYAFYKLVVKVTKKTRKAAFWQNANQQQENKDAVWHPLSQWLTNGKHNLLAMMMMGPRWNCNATLAISDMFYVEGNLQLDIEQANKSAKFWTAVIYNMNFKTIAHMGNTEETAKSEGKLSVPKGHYFIAIRYYETSQISEFPAVSIDGKSAIASLNSDEERVRYEKYLTMLSGYRSWLFLAMHYHAYAFLKNRQKLDAEWVNQTYLPVGNPETKFTYGTIKKGQKLRVSSLEYPAKRTYISIYNKASLPIYWAELTEQQETPPIDTSGTFAIRQISNACLHNQSTALQVELV